MKKMKFTLLTILLALFVQASFAQDINMTGKKVLVTDGTMMVTDSAAQDIQVPHNTNAILELKSSTKPLILPVIPFNTFTTITPAEGMICVTTGVPGFDAPAFHTLQFYFDEPGTGDDAWYQILTQKHDINSLHDVRRSGTARTSYYIGIGAGDNASSATENNTTFGYNAGHSITVSKANTLLGLDAGKFITTGNPQNNDGNNVAVGALSGITLVTGHSNTFVGTQTDATAAETAFSVAIGYLAKTTGDESIAIGNEASTNGFRSTAIGSGAATTKPNQVVLGTSSEHVVIPGLYGGTTTADSTTNRAVYVTDNGTLIVDVPTAPLNSNVKSRIEQLEMENAVLRSELDELRKMVEGILEEQ
jgi:hypothetical protein